MFDLVHSDPLLSIASSPSVVAFLWHDTPTLDAIAHLAPAIRRAAASGGGPIAVLVVIHTDTAPPGPTVRDAMSTSMRVVEAETLCCAVVYEGDGFKAAALRSVVTGISLVSKHRYKQRIFSTVPDAAQWIASESARDAAKPVFADDVVSGVRALRARIG